MNSFLKPKILVVDDDPVLQEFLRGYLKQQSFDVYSLLSGEGLSGFLESQSVDLILLDIMLPGRDGYYWLAWLKKTYPNIPILMLSVKKECDDRVQGLEMGANDYMVKPADPRELLARINNLLRCKLSSSTISVVKFGRFIFEMERCYLFCGKDMIRLTTTESQLLKIFCENIGRTLSRDELTFILRGNEHNPYDRSIDVHINRLRNKIEDEPSNPRYLLTTWGRGYRFIVEN